MQQCSRRRFLEGIGLAVSRVGRGGVFDMDYEPYHHDYVDAHVHVWERPNAEFPYDRYYEGPVPHPVEFTPKELLALAHPCGVGRIVLVQMSYYGTDNSFMLAIMKRYPSTFSGIAIVDHSSPALDAELRRLRAWGVRGLRIQEGKGGTGWLRTAQMRILWRTAAELGLAICCLINPIDIPEVGRICGEHQETTVVIDHMARIGMGGPIRDEDVRALCGLAEHPKVHVKVSAFYALGKKKAPYTDLVPLTKDLHSAYGARRLMWGSDSPFQVQPPCTYASSLDFVLQGMPFLNADDRIWMLRKTTEGLFF
jgi:predicted TIM-barrel fold metal-dependent hydrolase